MKINLQDIVMVGDLPITYSGRSLKITVSDICKKLGLTDEGGFRFVVLKSGLVLLRPIKDYEAYIEETKKMEKKKGSRIFEEAEFLF